MIHNILTISRIILAPIAFLAVIFEHKWHVALLCYAVISDILDGKVARYYNKTSQIGALLDVIADKIFLYCYLLGFIYTKNITTENLLTTTLILWIARDISNIFLFTRAKNKFKSLFIGKIYTGTQFLFMFFLVFSSTPYTIIFFNVTFAFLATATIVEYYKSFY